MKIEVELKKNYVLAIVGIAVLVAGVAGVYAALSGNFGHDPSEIDWSKQIAKINASQICLGNICNTAWPSGGGGGTSQWTTSGANIYYNAGNVGIGIASPATRLSLWAWNSDPASVSDVANLDIGSYYANAVVMRMGYSHSGYPYIQSHASLPLQLNPAGNAVHIGSGGLNLGGVTRTSWPTSFSVGSLCHTYYKLVSSTTLPVSASCGVGELVVSGGGSCGGTPILKTSCPSTTGTSCITDRGASWAGSANNWLVQCSSSGNVGAWAICCSA